MAIIMENPEIKFDVARTIPSGIEEKYIREHINTALVVANNSNKTIKLTRESDERPDIILYIKPGDSLDKIMKNYSEEIKKLTPDGVGKDGGNISSPKPGINQQDI